MQPSDATPGIIPALNTFDPPTTFIIGLHFKADETHHDGLGHELTLRPWFSQRRWCSILFFVWIWHVAGLLTDVMMAVSGTYNNGVEVEPAESKQRQWDSNCLSLVHFSSHHWQVIFFWTTFADLLLAICYHRSDACDQPSTASCTPGTNAESKHYINDWLKFRNKTKNLPDISSLKHVFSIHHSRPASQLALETRPQSYAGRGQRRS